jgi:hypothetical protein
LDKHASCLVKAMEGWDPALESLTQKPEGMFGRIAIIESSTAVLRSDELDIEFSVSFDDDLEANEAEITIYNLSRTTLRTIEVDNPITITAGYGDDTGVIFKGRISAVWSKWETMDKKTTIKAIDDVNVKEYDIEETAFQAGTTASYILKTLLDKVSLPVAVFSPRRDYTYKDEVNVSGGLLGAIQKYAQVCGISVYINKEQIYARSLSEGDNIHFDIMPETGMIGTPDEFTEEVKAEDYTDIINGYKIKMLLQHRMTVAAVVGLKSNNVLGTFRVRSGKHTFTPSESITEVEVVPNG